MRNSNPRRESARLFGLLALTTLVLLAMPSTARARDLVLLTDFIQANRPEVIIGEPLPEVAIGENEILGEKFKRKYGLIFFRDESNRTWVFRDTSEMPSKGSVRFFRRKNGSWHLAVRSATANQVMNRIHALKPSNYTIEYLGAGKEKLENVVLTSENLGLLLAALGKENGISISAMGLGEDAEEADLASATDWLARKPKPPKISSRHWDLTFLPKNTPDPTGATTVANQSSSKFAASIATGLNQAFGGGRTIATNIGKTILLNGPENKVAQMEKLLATAIDVPYAQVRINVWAVQMNTRLRSIEKSRERLAIIEEGMGVVRVLLNEFRYDLALVLRKLEDDSKDGLTLRKSFFRGVGFDVNRERPMTVLEALIFLAYVDRKELIETGFPLLLERSRQKVDRLKRRYAEASKDANRSKGERRRARALADLMSKIESELKADSDTLLLRRAYGLESVRHARPGIDQFVLAYLDVVKPNWRGTHGKSDPFIREIVKENPTRADSRYLTRKSAGADNLVKAGMDAFEADAKRLFFSPTIRWVREIARDTHDLNVVGNTEVVVTSGQPVQASSKATSFHPIIPQVDPEAEETDLATVVAAGDPLLAAAKVLLRKTPEPVFARVAPGVGLGARATVMPHSDGARVQIHLVNSTEADEIDKELIERGIQPVDFVNSTTVNTDVGIDGFDMLPLATFSSQTTRRSEPWRIPILSDVPLLGPLIFRVPQDPTVKNSEVMVLLYMSVIPRSIDLVDPP